MKKVISIGVAGMLLLAISAPQAAHAASDAEQLTSEQIVSTIASATGSIIEDSLPTETTQVSTTSTTSGVSVSAVDTHASDSAQVASVEILNSKPAASATNGSVTTFETDTGGASGAVAKTSDGFSIYTVISDFNAPDSYSYKLNLPNGVEISEFQGGYSLDDFKDFSAVITAPWAVDANGRNLHTWYTLNDDVLTQHIDLSDPTIAFPVVADPNWSYSLRFSLINIKTTEAWKEVQDCFSCYFPVNGAPKKFPSYDQLLPLYVGTTLFGNDSVTYIPMECKMGLVDNHNGLYGWYFNATANHIDGLGSWIRFRFMNTSSYPVLAVDAYIVNDFYAAGPLNLNQIYTSLASQNWQEFALRLDHRATVAI